MGVVIVEELGEETDTDRTRANATRLPTRQSRRDGTRMRRRCFVQFRQLLVEGAVVEALAMVRELERRRLDVRHRVHDDQRRSQA